jgi:hypothetical protein
MLKIATIDRGRPQDHQHTNSIWNKVSWSIRHIWDDVSIRPLIHAANFGFSENEVTKIKQQ